MDELKPPGASGNRGQDLLEAKREKMQVPGFSPHIKTGFLKGLSRMWKGGRETKSLEQSGDKFPEIHYDIFYSSHESAEDAAGFENEFKKADIYFPESRQWTQSALDLWNAVSSGDITPEDAIAQSAATRGKGFRLRVLRTLYNSRKPIGVVDLPAGHELNDQFVRNLDDFAFKFDKDFDAALENVKNFSIGADQSLREEYIVSHLKPEIERILDRYPALKAKDKINVLLSLGDSHSSVYHALRNRGEDVARTYPLLPFVFDYGHEIARRHRWGKDIDRTLLARAFAEMAFTNMLWRPEGDHHKLNLFIRKISSVFSPDEVQTAYVSSNNFEEFSEFLKEQLKEKGIVMPDSP